MSDLGKGTGYEMKIVLAEMLRRVPVVVEARH